MKKVFTPFIVLLFAMSVSAQAPEKMSYQAVIRNADGTLASEQLVGMRISILQGSTSGTIVYQETQAPTSNLNGLVNIEIGAGTTSDDFSSIDWDTGPYFLQTETDPAGGTSYTITGTNELLSVPYALYAKTAENASEKYSVGDFAHGGIVFWVDETGRHGLVCAKEDQNEGDPIQWYNGINTNTEAHGDGIYSGEMNTLLIIANQGSDMNDYAAGVCAYLRVTEGETMYGNWYLPSVEELGYMYENKAAIDSTALANGGSAFVSEAAYHYWSSSEMSDGLAMRQYFHNGMVDYGNKNHIGRVRAVRTF
ncbi:MAG: DUF1566 domain-containing protein [Bacteroidales bacterium]|nr:DUF1566 domain-containing protein [Bacteroidales bacterium]